MAVHFLVIIYLVHFLIITWYCLELVLSLWLLAMSTGILKVVWFYNDLFGFFLLRIMYTWSFIDAYQVKDVAFIAYHIYRCKHVCRILLCSPLLWWTTISGVSWLVAVVCRICLCCHMVFFDCGSVSSHGISPCVLLLILQGHQAYRMRGPCYYSINSSELLHLQRSNFQGRLHA